MENLVVDIASEGLCIGYLYNHPNAIEEYGEKIFPKYDFTDETIRFLYQILLDCWYQQGKVNETAINVYATTLSEEDKRKFNDIGGCNAFRRFGNVAETSVDNFEKILNRLKVYNTLRALQVKNINVLPYIEKFKDTTSDYVLKVYETALNQIAIYSEGANTPKNISTGIREYIEQLKKCPDVGYDTSFDMVDYYIRGIRPKKMLCIAAGTNQGKTRILTKILTHTSIKNETKAFLISTEQTDEEMKLQFTTSIYNNILCKDCSEYIEESDIAKGLLNEQQQEKLNIATQYFEKNSKIDFLCTSVYDLVTLKKLIKQQKLKNDCKIVVIDVMKPWRNKQQMGTNLSEWQIYSTAVEELRNLAIELNIAIIITSQLTPQSLVSGELELSSLAIGTHISFVLDTVMMFRTMKLNELQKFKVKLQQKENSFNGSIQTFDLSKTYMICKIVKNRGGEAGIELVLEVDKGQCKFKELGRLIRT